MTRTILHKKWRSATVLLAGIFLFAGCTSTGPLGTHASDPVRAVQPGDTAKIGVVCRLSDNRIVMASDKTLIGGSVHPVYVEKRQQGDVELTAVAPEAVPVKSADRPFEAEILVRLSKAVTGMRAGETRRVGLAAEDNPERSEQNYVMSLVRTRLRDKEITLTADEYRQKRNKNPQVGDPFTIDPAFPGKVSAVEGGKVTVRFTGKTGEFIDTHLGKALVTEDDKQFRVRIDAKEGDLVRTGPFVGRITSVDDRRIVVDYRNPFGRERLFCDVTVRAVMPAPEKSEKEKKLSREFQEFIDRTAGGPVNQEVKNPPESRTAEKGDSEKKNGGGGKP